MTLTAEDMVLCKRRNQLNRQLRKIRCWLKNPPVGATQADILFEKKIYGKLLRELDYLEWL